MRSRIRVSLFLLAALAGITHAADDRAAQLNAMYAEYW